MDANNAVKEVKLEKTKRGTKNIANTKDLSVQVQRAHKPNSKLNNIEVTQKKRKPDNRWHKILRIDDNEEENNKNREIGKRRKWEIKDTKGANKAEKN